MKRRSGRNKGGFTLIELLVVISVIALLVSILMPALNRAREQAQKVVCASQERQWGIAISQYASDNDQYFPRNDDAPYPHFWWIGPSMMEFFDEFLLPLEKRESTEGGYQMESNITHCPTQKRHMTVMARSAETRDVDVIGYCYIAYNWPEDKAMSVGVDYTADGENPNGPGWATRKRMDTQYKYAPVVTDMVSYGPGNWWDTSNNLAFASHPDKSAEDPGEPEGGNFLYEDGRVEWHDLAELDPGFCYVGSPYTGWWIRIISRGY